MSMENEQVFLMYTYRWRLGNPSYAKADKSLCFKILVYTYLNNMLYSSESELHTLEKIIQQGDQYSPGIWQYTKSKRKKKKKNVSPKDCKLPTNRAFKKKLKQALSLINRNPFPWIGQKQTFAIFCMGASSYFVRVRQCFRPLENTEQKPEWILYFNDSAGDKAPSTAWNKKWNSSLKWNGGCNSNHKTSNKEIMSSTLRHSSRTGLASSHHSSLHGAQTSPVIATNWEQTYLVVKMWTSKSTKKSAAEWWRTFLMVLNEKFRYEDLWNLYMVTSVYTTSCKVSLYPMNKMKFYILTK